jgi:hypothetical protein
MTSFNTNASAFDILSGRNLVFTFDIGWSHTPNNPVSQPANNEGGAN